jgi:peptide/nickel transport system substrate-binding protein
VRGRSSSPSIDALCQVVFNGEFTPGNQWSSPTNPYYIK